MSDSEKEFQQRRKRRLEVWKARVTHGFSGSDLDKTTSSPEENLSYLEDIRKIVYPEIGRIHMNKNIARLYIR